jgi:hypothetical protein
VIDEIKLPFEKGIPVFAKTKRFCFPGIKSEIAKVM